MKDVYLVSCCRTAIGTFGGTLKDVPAAQLGSIVAKAGSIWYGSESLFQHGCDHG